MARYTLSRLALALPVLLLVTAITFFSIHIIPGDLAAAKLGDNANPESVAALRQKMGLDAPIVVQYLRWLKGLISGNPGISLTSDQPVAEQLRRRLPVTLELAALSACFSLLIGVPLGVLSALRRGKPTDHVVRVVAVLGQAVPSFWLGILALTVLSIYFSWAPPVTYAPIWVNPFANVQQFALPVLITGYALSAVVMRVTRSAMLDVLSQDYIRVARSKGLAGGVVIYRHAMRNALIPIVTIAATQIGALVGGTILVETVFSLPGVGRLTLAAINDRDYTQLQFNVVVFGAVVLLVNLAADLTYVFLDPRIRHRT